MVVVARAFEGDQATHLQKNKGKWRKMKETGENEEKKEKNIHDAILQSIRRD